MKALFASRSAVCVLGFAFVTACGGGGKKTADLSVVADLSAPGGDLAGTIPGPDLRGVDFAGVSCGAQSCSAGQICCNTYESGSMSLEQMCVTGASCGDGGIEATCDGPEDCSGATSCCISVDVNHGTPSGEASCMGSCAGSATQASGDTMITSKLCHGAADCVNYSGSTPIGPLPFSACCSYPGVSYKICAPGLITALDNSITCTN